MIEPLGFDPEYAAAPLSRAEAYLLVSKLKRMISLAGLAAGDGRPDVAREYAAQIPPIERELEERLEALIIPLKGGEHGD